MRQRRGVDSTLLLPGGAALDGEYADVFVPKPAPGADWSYTLPAGSWYQLVLGYARLKTNAEAVGRVPTFVISDGDGLRRYRSHEQELIEPSFTCELSYAIRVFQTSLNKGFTSLDQVPEVWLPGGWSIGSAIKELKPGDQLDQVRLRLAQVDDTEPAQAPGSLLRDEPHWSTVPSYAP